MNTTAKDIKQATCLSPNALIYRTQAVTWRGAWQVGKSLGANQPSLDCFRRLMHLTAKDCITQARNYVKAQTVYIPQ